MTPAPIAELFDAGACRRRGLRSNGGEFTVATISVYHLHDIAHHAHDVSH